MWGFRPVLNRTFSNHFLQILLNQPLIARYGGRRDQDFLAEFVWPQIQNNVIAHDSFLCQTPYGKNSLPWPTRRVHPSNNISCFVGCVRPCCTGGKYPFGECPMSCRPENHTDWTMC